jgi:hypothetical protein
MCHLTAPSKITPFVLSTITAWLLQVTPSFQMLRVIPSQKSIFSVLPKVTSAQSSTLLQISLMCHLTCSAVQNLLLKGCLKGHTQCFDQCGHYQVLKFCFGEIAMLIYSQLVLFLQSHVYTGGFVCDSPLFLFCLSLWLPIKLDWFPLL